MARRRRKRKKSPIEELRDELAKAPWFDLKPETKKSIVGILLFCLGVVIVLAFSDLAGPLGRQIHSLSNFLFGWGGFLFPIVIFSLSLVFLASDKEYRLYFTGVFGAAFFLASGLGIISVIRYGKGGLIGDTVSNIERALGFWASLVVLGCFLTISLLMIFNVPLHLGSWLRGRSGREKEPRVIIGSESAPDFAAVSPSGPEEEFELAQEKILAKEQVKISKKLKEKQDAEIQRRVLQKFDYHPPSLDLLEGESGRPTVGDIKANANIIKRTLENFGVLVEMGEVNIGPTVTRYTLKPASGVKLSRIVALQNDLALALAAHPIRIEAPIPGKSLVGIEVPNRSVTLVRVRNLIQSEYFRNSHPLVFPVGRDVAGEPVYANLGRMPHLLIAGATGTGKSIMIHSTICSFLYKNSPKILNFILIDPKRVELILYEKLPHLITPVITDPKKAIIVLRWATHEMDRRYGLLLKENVRDVIGYNQRISRRIATHPEEVEDEILPYLVIVIDELADLMATYGREVEASIVRLAQMARATGLHLIVSTQRPSVEVVTGLIKANITSRIAFQVASQVDSRTILDTAGAEKLLGNGDMLFMSSESSKPKRIQGVFVSENEIKRVVNFIVKHSQKLEDGLAADLEEALVQHRSVYPVDLDALEEELVEGEEDEFYQEAYRVVVEAQKASASYLQRRLRIGYARAARLLDLLEEKGVIGPGKGAKPREVYVKREGIEQGS